jgi:hypothetical protein
VKVSVGMNVVEAIDNLSKAAGNETSSEWPTFS